MKKTGKVRTITFNGTSDNTTYVFSEAYQRYSVDLVTKEVMSQAGTAGMREQCFIPDIDAIREAYDIVVDYLVESDFTERTDYILKLNK